MKEVTERSLETLSVYIAEELQRGFRDVFLSGNLRDTIWVEQVGETFQVHVPAVCYNIPIFLKTGVVIYDQGDKSYAKQVDITGGWSGKHKNYVENAIQNALTRWMAEMEMTKAKMEER